MKSFPSVSIQVIFCILVSSSCNRGNLCVFVCQGVCKGMRPHLIIMLLACARQKRFGLCERGVGFLPTLPTIVHCQWWHIMENKWKCGASAVVHWFQLYTWQEWRHFSLFHHYWWHLFARKSSQHSASWYFKTKRIFFSLMCFHF